MVVPIGEPPTRQGFFNQLKQEYTVARYLLHQGLHRHAPTYPDSGVKLWDTLDYPAYGINLELTKLAYRSCYSLLDKIAYFLNDYLHLNIPERRVTFQTLWYKKEERDRDLKQFFVDRPNLPLRGLYWLSKDLDDKKDRSLAPDAALLATLRQHLEHKYLKTHEPDWTLAQGDPLRTDTLALSIERRALEHKALRIAKLARAGLLYLTLGMHIEEILRRVQHGYKDVPPMALSLIHI